MKLLIFTHQLEVGGCQLNSIELGAALRDLHGYEVVMFGTPGPMVKLIEEKNLRYIPAPAARYHPSPARGKALREVVRNERPDVILAADWFQCLDSYYSVHLPWKIPLVVIDMMMSLTRVLPKSVPTTFGTPELVDLAKAAGRHEVELILPPVDINLNAPGAADPGPVRRAYDLRADQTTIVTVSRLDSWMKRESLMRSLEAVRVLSAELPLRFLIVGDGTERANLERLAQQINVERDREVVTMTGAMLDPRPAYLAADIVIGMGGASLRAMAMGKPVIVVGEKGFSRPFNQETANYFYYKGMYGTGDGDPGNEQHIADIRSLAVRSQGLEELGEFSRNFVVQHFSLESVSARMEAFCRKAIAEMPSRYTLVASGLRTAAVYLRERRFLTPSGPSPAQNAQGVRFAVIDGGRATPL